MNMFVALDTAEPQNDSAFAGMTQVMNVHTRTVMVSDSGNYLFPRSVAMVNSKSLALQSGIEKGWLFVINTVPERDASEIPQADQKKKKKAQPIEEQPVSEEAIATEEVATEVVNESQNSVVEEVAPQQEENSL